MFELVQWQQLQLGDLVLMHQNEHVPADLLILDMWEEYCSVDERYLNDETNDKMKFAINLTKGTKFFLGYFSWFTLCFY